MMLRDMWDEGPFAKAVICTFGAVMVGIVAALSLMALACVNYAGGTDRTERAVVLSHSYSAASTITTYQPIFGDKQFRSVPTQHYSPERFTLAVDTSVGALAVSVDSATWHAMKDGDVMTVTIRVPKWGNGGMVTRWTP